MAVLPIIIIGDPLLRRRAEPVTEFDAALSAFSGEMLETLVQAEGLGLAAPQVGRSIRLFVARNPETMPEPVIFINPRIISHKLVETRLLEGCLSVPDDHWEVSRWQSIRLRWQDLAGVQHEERFVDLDARIMQHELDHLDGIIFVDRLSDPDKAQAREKWRAKNVQ